MTTMNLGIRSRVGERRGERLERTRTLVMPLKRKENTRITAETVERMSWPQKPHRPRVRHAFAVRCTFFAMLAVESSGDLSAARVTAGRRERDARAAAGADRAHCSDAKGAEPACAARWVSARAAAGTRAREARAPADARTDATGRRDARARDAMGAGDCDHIATVGCLGRIQWIGLSASRDSSDDLSSTTNQASRVQRRLL